MLGIVNSFYLGINQKLTLLMYASSCTFVVVGVGYNRASVPPFRASRVACVRVGARVGAPARRLREENGAETPVYKGILGYTEWKSRRGVTVPRFSTQFPSFRTPRNRRTRCTRRCMPTPSSDGRDRFCMILLSMGRHCCIDNISCIAVRLPYFMIFYHSYQFIE